MTRNWVSKSKSYSPHTGLLNVKTYSKVHYGPDDQGSAVRLLVAKSRHDDFTPGLIVTAVVDPWTIYTS